MKKKYPTRNIKIVGKRGADAYSFSLKTSKVPYKRKKVGPRSYMFTLNPQETQKMPNYLGKSYPYSYEEMTKEEKKMGKKERKIAAPMMAAARKGKKQGMAALRRLRKY